MFQKLVFTSLLTVLCILTTTASKSGNWYLEYLFHKYGNHQGISFEGLEHLMFNLGIGNLEFNPSHTITEHRPKGYKIPKIDENGVDFKIDFNESEILQYIEAENNKIGETSKDIVFMNLHDPNHKHLRHRDELLTTSSCLSPKTLLRRVYSKQNSNKRSIVELEQDSLFDDQTSKIIITPFMFLNLCPALIAQIDGEGCSNVVRIELGKLEKGLSTAWMYATISIIIISLCGLIGIGLIPLMKTIAYDDILRFLVAIAIGTLCGDALMHLLPHALTPHDGLSIGSIKKKGTDEKESVWICSCAFFSALFMYTLENLLPILRLLTGSKHSHAHEDRPHETHSYVATPYPLNVEKSAPTEATEIAMEVFKYVDEKEQKILKDSRVISSKKSLSPLAFMVIFGDGLHNLTDGLAIGAAFAVDPVTGMATALAVLCHELPHELGDFALLIQSGVSIRRAIFFNIVSSILGFIGMIIGLVLVGVNTNSVRWIYAVTSGSFLYIALADLIPEINHNNKACPKTLLLQFIGICSGGIIMLIIGLYEDNLRSFFE